MIRAIWRRWHELRGHKVDSARDGIDGRGPYRVEVCSCRARHYWRS